MSAPENPWAFPCVTEAYLQEGMTLRDWFAGQALAGMCARTGQSPTFAGKDAYALADALLATRQGDK